jgi:flagellar M-ring protein FliF
MSAEAATLPGYSRFPPGVRSLLLLVGVAAAIAAGVFVALWSKGPSFSLLYANLAASDQAQIAQALDSAAIPYQLEPASNGISVPVERINEARLKLAGQGLPEGGGGFALMSKDPGFGVSQFMEGARYQHALEQELARTIASLRPVDGARVHLAVPRQSAFVRDRKQTSASVFVQLKAGKRLEQEQVQAIINLVASSIPELDSSKVTVVDQQGRLLSSPQSDEEAAMREHQFELAQRLEEDYAQRIEALLAPFVGAGRVRAQVVAQLDSSVTEETREQFRPESQIVRSEQTSEQLSREGAGPQGVPGALTNQPPTAGTALPPGVPAAATPSVAGADAAAATAAATPQNSARESTRNYEIDRTLAYTRQPSGRLQRLTVAVLIDNLRAAGADGKVTETPLPQEQLDRITQLVKDAVGYDEKRGDSVNVVNASFREEAPIPDGEIEKLALWEQPMIRDIAKLVAGLIVLLVLVFTVLRPLVKGLLSPSRPTFAAPAMEAAVAGGPRGGPGVASATSASNAAQPLAYEQQLAQARTLVGQDPKRVAQAVRTMVAQDD